jgi:hypothetical protein
MNPRSSRHWMGMRTCRSQRCRLARACRGSILVLGVVALLATAGCSSESGQATHAKPAADDDRVEASLVDAQQSADPAASPTAIEHQLLHAGFDPQSPCTCQAAILSHRWCWRCNVGYVAGRRIECARLFEALDPHGHELDNESLQLQGCREAIRSDGYCDAMGIGFVAGKAFFTRLTYGVARGEAIDPATTECPVCQAHVHPREPGWCESCRRGIVGNVAIADRDMFERTAREYRILSSAIDKASACEFCACAMVAHLTCPKCQISYESVASVASAAQGDADPMSFMTVKPNGGATALRDPTHQTQEEIKK